jgi:hypothetical protein
VEDTLPQVAAETLRRGSVLEHLWDPAACLAHCHCVLFRLGASPACEMDDHKMHYGKRELWPLLVRAGFRPSRIRMRYRKLSMILFSTAVK